MNDPRVEIVRNILHGLDSSPPAVDWSQDGTWEWWWQYCAEAIVKALDDYTSERLGNEAYYSDGFLRSDNTGPIISG